MEILENYKEKSEKIAMYICNFYQIPIFEIYNKKGDATIQKAKLYIYVILQQHYGVSTYKIADTFNKCRNNICKCLSKIKYRIANFKEDKEEYIEIMKYIKEREDSN